MENITIFAVIIRANILFGILGASPKESRYKKPIRYVRPRNRLTVYEQKIRKGKKKAAGQLMEKLKRNAILMLHLVHDKSTHERPHALYRT